jgi:oligoribonuclease NrnB/cAMP/cGMP phosphodiesterase (DHH superfamily)
MSDLYAGAKVRHGCVVIKYQGDGHWKASGADERI